MNFGKGLPRGMGLEPCHRSFRIRGVDILDRLFGEVIIPNAVADELHPTHTNLPEWLRVEEVSNQDLADEYMLG